MAEHWVDDGVSLSNEVIVEALVRFYGCRKASEVASCREIDMYFARERACGPVYSNMMENKSYERDGLNEFILANHGSGLSEPA